MELNLSGLDGKDMMPSQKKRDTLCRKYIQSIGTKKEEDIQTKRKEIHFVEHS